MGEPLTLPGDLPGLLRRGSPLALGRGVVLATSTAGGVTRVQVADYGGEPRLYRADEGVALDLSDPTGQYHAALWLLKQDGCDTSGGARWVFCHGHRGAVLKIEGIGHTVLHASLGDVTSWEVPALADCKTAAEALRCAVLARAGGAG